MSPVPHIVLPERYRVLRHVATGGMASVYAAADELLGREVAVKVLSPALGADGSARQRFTREARAAATVGDHPNVVTIFDIGETEGDPPLAFIVMELLTGGTIQERLRSGDPIPHTQVLRWLAQAAAALDAAHAAGMVHRDVKPANLLLTANGTLKVADFGIATLASEAPLTATGQVVGTAAYFSPEQAMGRPATAASDRYALAVLAFELLTGSRPFPPGPPAAQALAHVDARPPLATQVAPGLPGGVDAVLCAGMAKDPGQRPASASELVRRLEAALGATATTGVTVPAVGVAAAPPPLAPPPAAAARPRTPRPPAAPVPLPPRGAEPVRAASRSRAGVLAALAALLVAGAAIAAVAGGGGGDEPASRAQRTATAERSQPQRTRPTTTASSAPATAPAPAAPAPTGGAPADAAAIQAAAHEKLLAGDYAGAAAQLRGLVDRCPVAVTDPCAYAWFDLGSALRQGGDPAAAIPVLEQRLTNPNQRRTVQAELAAARAAAAGGSSGEEADDGHGNGRGRGKGKD